MFDENDLVHGWHENGDFVVSVIGRVVMVDPVTGTVWVDDPNTPGARWGLSPDVYKIERVEES